MSEIPAKDIAPKPAGSMYSRFAEGKEEEEGKKRRKEIPGESSKNQKIMPYEDFKKDKEQSAGEKSRYVTPYQREILA